MRISKKEYNQLMLEIESLTMQNEGLKRQVDYLIEDNKRLLEERLKNISFTKSGKNLWTIRSIKFKSK